MNAKSVNFLQQSGRLSEIEGEDNQSGSKTSADGGELDNDPFDSVPSTRIRVTVHKVNDTSQPSVIGNEDEDLVPSNSKKNSTAPFQHRSSPTSEELVDPHIDEYSDDPFEAAEKRGVARLTAPIVRPPPQ
ncbi:hypothetical protein Ddc_01847 [Ditylenchus destructor]|nr:hypothetical protein Ddc_01847 [Ditylenchus destructor]